MKDYFFNTRDDFHYDHSGYYGYIVFNGDTKTRDGLLKALGQGAQPGGLGWYRYGKSFRPANDGKMYNWYIRLHSGGNDKPAAQAVDDFLRGHLEPPKPEPAPQPPAQGPIVATQLTKDLFQLQSDIARETATHQEAFSAQRRLSTLLGKLQGIDTRISDDLENLRRDLQDIADTWRADNWSNLNLGSVIRALDEVNVHLTDDLARLQRDYSDIASAHADTLRAQSELAQVLERLKEHDTHISKDLTRLQQDVQRIAAHNGQVSADDGQTALLARFSALEEKLLARIEQLQSAVRDGTAAQAELEEIRETLQEAQQARSAANMEIENLREIIESKQPSAIEGLNEENKVLKKSLKKNRDEHKTTVADLRKQIHNQKQEHRRVAEKLVYWKQQHEDAVAELNQQKDAVTESNGREPEPQRSNGRVTSSELEDILKGAFPGLVLAQDSLGTLYHGIQNYRPIMALLHKIVNDRSFNGRNPIRGNKKNTKWREDVVSEDWRIYFCKESRLLGDKFVVYLGDKNHQDDDMAWLRANPPETCL